jgi:hypothetical protein
MLDSYDYNYQAGALKTIGPEENATGEIRVTGAQPVTEDVAAARLGRRLATCFSTAGSNPSGWCEGRLSRPVRRLPYPRRRFEFIFNCGKISQINLYFN